jgi:hypothetical protein
MANPTTNYGFVLPTATDLVTDLPADFDVALQGVDTRLKALQPGTTLGDLAYSSATANTNTRLGIGSTGNVLTVTGGVPVWAAPAAGAGMTLISTTSLSGGTTSLTSISGAYVDLALYIVNFYASVQVTLSIQVNAQTTGYTGVTAVTNNTTSSIDSGLDTAMRCTNAITIAASSANNNIAATFPNYATATGKKIGLCASAYEGNTGNRVIENIAYHLPISGALTQIDIKTSSGTWSGGIAYLYGVK